jgi:SAM-dependent methyltransferase
MTYPEDHYDPFRNIHTTDQVAPHPLQCKRAQGLTDLIGTGKVLDVGCADGLFLSVMRDTGWSCVGVEPDPGAATFARTQLKLDVGIGDIFTETTKQSFDLITLWDVLEHTPSPTQVLKHAAQLLKPYGWLALSLPNWNSLERQLFQERWIALDAPRHLYHFSTVTIGQMLTMCGFTSNRIDSHAPVLSLASNVLRFAGDHRYRGGKAKALVTADPAVHPPDQPSVSKQRLIRLTQLLMTPLMPLPISFSAAQA